jgi:hypothetical protein
MCAIKPPDSAVILEFRFQAREPKEERASRRENGPFTPSGTTLSVCFLVWGIKGLGLVTKCCANKKSIRYLFANRGEIIKNECEAKRE